MHKDIRFVFRTDKQERELIALVAQRLDRTESDTMRLIVRQVAAQLGVTAPPQTDRRTDQMEQAA